MITLLILLILFACLIGAIVFIFIGTLPIILDLAVFGGICWLIVKGIQALSSKKTS